jgi:hypothetical protein
MGANAVYFEPPFQHFPATGNEYLDNSESEHLPFGPGLNPPPSKYKGGVQSTKNQRLWLLICDLALLADRLTCY